MKILKVRVTEQNKSHVCVTLFMGEENQTLANIGELCMTPTEYQLFSAALSLGCVTTPNEHYKGFGVSLLIKKEEE